MNVNLPLRMLRSVVLIVALVGCAAPAPGSSAPVAETATGAPASAAVVVEEPSSPEPLAETPASLQAEAPVDAGARSAAATTAPPLAAEPEPPPATATQPPAPTEPPAQEPPPTVAPTKEPAPTEAPAQPAIEASTVAQLQEELWVTGPPIMMIMFCLEAPEEVEMPAASWEGGLDSGHLCLWGFPAGEEIAYEFYEAGGDLVAAGAAQAEEFLEGPSVAEVTVEMGDQASGDWTVRAASPSAQLDTTIPVEITPAPRLRAVPGPQVAAGHTLRSLAAGDQVTVSGSGMPENATVALGIYKTEDGADWTIHYQLVFSGTVRTDGTGRFESMLTIEPSDPAGDYCVVVPLAADYMPGTAVTFDGATACFTVTQ